MVARTARLISVNVGTPTAIGTSKGEQVVSAIYKRPLKGKVMVRRLNVDGDKQANSSVHGGELKAVYLYASEHYGDWKRAFPAVKMPWGTFGENFTTEGVLEEDVHVGDQFAIGDARFEATRPRLPCFKLGMRFGTDTIVKSFLDSEHTGFYLRVLHEGMVQSGDPVRRTRVRRDKETISEAVRKVKAGK